MLLWRAADVGWFRAFTDPTAGRRRRIRSGGSAAVEARVARCADAGAEQCFGVGNEVEELVGEVVDRYRSVGVGGGDSGEGGGVGSGVEARFGQEDGEPGGPLPTVDVRPVDGRAAEGGQAAGVRQVGGAFVCSECFKRVSKKELRKMDHTMCEAGLGDSVYGHRKAPFSPPHDDCPEAGRLASHMAIHPSHKVSRVLGTVMCWECAAYTVSGVIVGLNNECPKRIINESKANVRRRVSFGLPPTTQHKTDQDEEARRAILRAQARDAIQRSAATEMPEGEPDIQGDGHQAARGWQQALNNGDAMALNGLRGNLHGTAVSTLLSRGGEEGPRSEQIRVLPETQGPQEPEGTNSQLRQ